MSVLKDFENFLRLGKYFGVISVTYEYHRSSSQLFVIKRDTYVDKLPIILVLISILLTGVTFLLLKKSIDNYYDHNETSSNIINTQVFVDPAFRVVALLWIYLSRHQSFKIVQTILKHLRDVEEISCNGIRKLYYLTVVMILFLTFNLWPVYFYLEQNYFLAFLNVVINFMKLAFFWIWLSFFTCILLSIHYIFKILNRDLQILINAHHKSKNWRIIEILRQRSDLVNLCNNDVNSVFGVAMLWLTGQLFAMVPSMPVLTATVILKRELSWPDVLLLLSIITLNSPQIIFYCLALMCNSLEEEANKTARILSRVSWKGTGLEKMIDKFLMKNMQQKPILTAYGFFPLNKRTLFKIFAAILTYMVILVQFKGMENTNKKISADKKAIATVTELTVS